MSELSEDLMRAAQVAYETTRAEWPGEDNRDVRIRAAVGAALNELLRKADARDALAVSVTTLTSLVRELAIEHPAEDGTT